MSLKNTTLDVPSSVPWPLSTDTIYVVASCVALVGIGLLLMPFGPFAAVLPAAGAFGLTQVGGACGVSHLNTMTFFWHKRPQLWVKGVTAYTLAGLISATGTGLAVGLIGKVAKDNGIGLPLAWVTLLAVVLALRECRVIDFPLPEQKCQTERTWAFVYGWVHASAMWGFHIGLGFFTVITYGGFWVLVGLILTQAEPAYGALTFGIYWLGRTLPFWAVPLRGQREPFHVTWHHSRYRIVQVVGLVWCVIATAWVSY